MRIKKQRIQLLALMMSSYFFMTLQSFSAMASSDDSSLEQPEKIENLPLECSKIPALNERLCFIQTQSPYGPYDDIVIYRMDKNGYATLLGSQQGDVATFGGFEFSSGGRYMQLSWAEEGHPHFIFYNTRKFLENGLNTETIEILGDYYFEYFIKFTDTGEVVYALSDGAYEDCNRAGKDVSYELDSGTSEKVCVKKFNLGK